MQSNPTETNRIAATPLSVNQCIALHMYMCALVAQCTCHNTDCKLNIVYYVVVVLFSFIIIVVVAVTVAATKCIITLQDTIDKVSNQRGKKFVYELSATCC